MSGIEMSLLDEQELGRQFEQALNNGELGSLIDTDADFNLPEEATGLDTTDGQFGDVVDNNIFDQSTDFGLFADLGGPVQINDFTANAPIDFTLPADYQVSQYPALEDLAAPNLPYFQAPAADFNYPVQPLDNGYGTFSQDQSLWDPRWNCDQFDPGVGLPMGPPPVPVHSKPNLQVPSEALVQNPSNRYQAPVAVMTPQDMPPPQSGYASSGSEWAPTPATKPAQRGRKRKAASLASADGEPLDLVEKRRRIDDAIDKATYRLGMYRDINPDEVNRRTAQIHKFDPTTVYDPITRTPPQWGIFKYNPYGELETGRFYTAGEIATYLFHHPLHTLQDGTYAPKLGGLRLYIQRNPADSARRYPSTRSNRCRFADCFATHNLINQGHLRVCFTEHHPCNRNKTIDPFNCAGYVHLNCLERLLDFPQLCANLAIAPEDRNLPAPDRNRAIMASASSNEIAEKFIKDCKSGVLEDYPKGARPHKGSLTWRLLTDKCEKQKTLLKRQGDERGVKSSHMSVHLGDLEVEGKNRDKTRRARWKNARKTQDLEALEVSEDGEEERQGEVS